LFIEFNYPWNLGKGCGDYWFHYAKEEGKLRMLIVYISGKQNLDWHSTYSTGHAEVAQNLQNTPRILQIFPKLLKTKSLKT